MRKAFLAALVCAASLALGGVATAQERATLLLKSGERVTGQLVDMGGRGFAMEVRGEIRRIPTGDVAVVDFTGSAKNLPEAEVTRVRAGRNVLVTRGGQVIEGTLEDVGGRQPLRITFIVGGNKHDYSSNDVGRIYLARPGAEALPGGTPGGGVVEGVLKVQVLANRQWNQTGITVRKGEIVQFSSTGEVRLSPTAGDVSGVDGRIGYLSPRATAPRVLLGALIGRVGSGEPFGLGGQKSVPMPNDGQLYLGVNDADFSDNSGQFTVGITATGAGAGGRAIPRG